MPELEEIEFKYSNWNIYFGLACGIIFGVMGFDDLFSEKLELGIFFLLLSFATLMTFFIYIRNPYIQITRDEIRVSGLGWKILTKPKIIKWNAIKKINKIDRNKVEFLLSNDKKYKILLLRMVSYDDAENIVKIIKEVIKNKNQKESESMQNTD